MNIYALKGHKVRFTGEGGYATQNEYARKHLEIGGVYEVDHTQVFGWTTDVYLVGLERTAPDIQENVLQDWNSVMFEDVEPQSPEDDRKHPQHREYNQPDEEALPPNK